MATKSNKTSRKSLNRSLIAAKAARQDEFYTQYVDMQKEVQAYLEFDLDTFGAKTVYCNSDDPFESNPDARGLTSTTYGAKRNWGSRIAGQMTLFDEYSAGKNSHRPGSFGRTAAILIRWLDGLPAKE